MQALGNTKFLGAVAPFQAKPAQAGAKRGNLQVHCALENVEGPTAGRPGRCSVAGGQSSSAPALLGLDHHAAWQLGAELGCRLSQ